MTNEARKRITSDFDAELYRALHLKSAETEKSVSYLVNDAVKMALSEDADDVLVFEARGPEPDYAFETVNNDLLSRGKS